MVYDRNIKFDELQSVDLYKYLKVGAIYNKKVLEDYVIDCNGSIVCSNETLDLSIDSEEEFIVKEIHRNDIINNKEVSSEVKNIVVVERI